MRGVGLVGGRMVNSGGKLFFVWTLIAVGMTSLFSVILAVRGLWSLPWRRRT
jgi:heme exporter protein D